VSVGVCENRTGREYGGDDGRPSGENEVREKQKRKKKNEKVFHVIQFKRLFFGSTVVVVVALWRSIRQRHRRQYDFYRPRPPPLFSH
jgi:hypothetical protein